MSGYIPCSVPGCDDRKSSRHRFPNPVNDIERFNTWIQLLANPKLGQMDPIRVYNNFRVCHQHFTTDDKSTNLLLKRTTVPSRNLPSRIDFIDVHSLSSTSTTSCTTEDPLNSTSVQSYNEQCSFTGERCVTPTHGKRTQTLLKDLGVIKSGDLTPRAKHMYAVARKLQAKNIMNRKRTVTLKDRLKAAKNVLVASHTDSGHNVIKFYMQQLLKKTGKAQGKRYNAEEKLMCLALYKASGSAYRILAKWFDLPSSRTISRILHRIPMEPGISSFVFEQLQTSVNKMTIKDKVCLLMFDEVSLLPHVEYRKHEDQIVGLEGNKIVDHALVFMVKGILSNWKQVVAYSFCKGTTTATSLEILLKTVLQKLNASGLNVIATVCDQGATNRRAIENLLQNSRQHYLKNKLEPKRCIVIDDKEVTPLYDVPHLLKGIRNNLLTKNLIWETKNKVIVGRWDHVITAYEIDHTTGDVRTIPQITKYHVRKEYIKKMKVCYATQVLSHSMGAAISSMARNNESDKTGQHKMDKSGYDTVAIIMFFDQLFDSLNGEKGGKKLHKPLRSAVTKTSSHLTFWKNAIESLKKMYFRAEGTNERKKPPSLNNFITTIQGFINVTETIFSMRFDQYYARKLNQDAVENFFSQIRQHRGRLINPTCSQFGESYKSLFFRHLAGSHGRMANCEKTCEMPLLQFRNITNLNNVNIKQPIIEEPRIHMKIINIVNETVQPRIMEYLIENLKQTINTEIKCKLCHLHIFNTNLDTVPQNTLGHYKPYFLDCIKRTYAICTNILNTESVTNNVNETISLYVKRYVHYSFICLHKELTTNLIIQKMVLLCIYNFCKNINNIIKKKVNVQYRPGMSNTLMEAINIHNKK